MKANLLESRPTSLLRFFAETVFWFLLLVVVWMPISPWTSYPAGWLTHFALEEGARQWVRKVHRTPQLIEADTNIRVAVGGKDARMGHAELVVDADPSRYGYGLPLFLALLIAARTRRLVVRAVAGYVLLIFPQAFATTMVLLRDMVAYGSGANNMGVAQWQLEAIAFGFQIGTLLLPALAPIVLWLWFDRAFLAALVIDGWLRKQSMSQTLPGSPASTDTLEGQRRREYRSSG